MKKDTSDVLLIRAQVRCHMGGIFSYLQQVPGSQRSSELIYYARLGWDSKHNPVESSPRHPLGASEPTAKATHAPPPAATDKMKSYIQSLGNIEDSLMPPSA